jgi:succinyl-CoA synthetase beta subunit
MNIHEYQGKQLFSRFGVNVLENRVAKTGEEAAKAFDELGGSVAVVKAQIHAGGRGKGTFKEKPEQHGVQLVKSAEEAKTAAANMIGNLLVTIQTGPEGKQVNQVIVEAGCDIDRELYLGIVLDRETKMPVLMCSQEGGVEIEKVAHETPEKIFKETFDPAQGIESYQVRGLCKQLGITGLLARRFENLRLENLSKRYKTGDLALNNVSLDIPDGQLVALDAKINFDSNALYRQKDVMEMRDLSEEEESEVRAADSGLSYVKLEGNIGCLVNGAGLAMGTMDIIKLHGGQPANFLDVGGGAKTEQVTEAFRIILSDKNVKAVLVNIFGGIMKCSTIAEAVVAAAKTVGFTVPLVVRLEGTEVEAGRKILEESDVELISATDLDDAAKKVVATLA